MTEEPAVEVDGAEYRATKFGALPPRVHPDDAVALTETDVPRVRPDDGAGGEDQWMLRNAAG
ncbi:hypothetical protein [Actinoplanes sp. NPDC089786]|uniref:hypothetical protein n=1 Tax=Actinoplanes sp. NPDC089786 TaxID=3155185 RepID=UPI0034187758